MRPSLFTSATTWVRFNGTGGTQIATTSPGINACNTQATGWYASAMPSITATVMGTVCYAWTSSTCAFANSIFVTNCGPYYVYGLISPPNCDMRYCTV
jgi:hypothetical protein